MNISLAPIVKFVKADRSMYTICENSKPYNSILQAIIGHYRPFIDSPI